MKILANNKPLSKADSVIAKLIKQEEKRQADHLEMIPSENYVSKAVLEAMGSVLTNKYAEGYPGKRYYHGNEFVDQVEQLAIDRAKKLFGADHANVQPMSGALANMATYEAVLKPGDKVLSIELSQGGHLTHGSGVNFSGQKYKFHFYEVNPETGRLDYKQIAELAMKLKPRLILAGTTAYPRKIDFRRFGSIAKKSGALFMADIAHIAGLIVGGLHQSPVPYADVVTTTTHKTLRGPRGAIILCKEKHAKAVDRAVFPKIQAGPLEHIIAAKAVCFKEASTAGFRKYQEQIIRNTKALEKSLKSNGFKLTTGGTDNHLMVMDLTPQKMTGQQTADLLEKAGIIVNKNTIPFDPLPPTVTSGIRLGTPALTTRGMKEAEMELIGGLISEVINNPDSLSEVSKKVKLLCRKFK